MTDLLHPDPPWVALGIVLLVVGVAIILWAGRDE